MYSYNAREKKRSGFIDGDNTKFKRNLKFNFRKDNGRISSVTTGKSQEGNRNFYQLREEVSDGVEGGFLENFLHEARCVS